MGVGGTFCEALQKALRGVGRRGFEGFEVWLRTRARARARINIRVMVRVRLSGKSPA